MASEGRNLVGVDIGSSSIKVCEIREVRGVRQLVRFGLHPLPPDTIVDGHIINSAAVVEGLEKLFYKASRRNVALRASGHSVIIKKVVMPLMTQAELNEQIQWEAEKHIPFDVTEVHIDHQVLHQREAEGQMDVLLVAAKREEIADLTNLALEARLKPVVVDLDAFTIQNVYEQAYGAPAFDEVIALIHVGASLTTVNILAGGTTAFTRDVTSAGNSITDEIQRRLNVNRETAETYKVGGDGISLVPPEVPEIISQSVDRLAGEIQRSLDFYLATSGDRALTRIILSGGTANVPALLSAIRTRAGVSVELLDPMRVAQPDVKFDPLTIVGRHPQSVVALGLALRKEKERRR